MEETPKPRKKSGPVAGPPRIKYTILLDEKLGEWAKNEPEGLSGLTRDLLTAEKKRRSK